MSGSRTVSIVPPSILLSVLFLLQLFYNVGFGPSTASAKEGEKAETTTAVEKSQAGGSEQQNQTMDQAIDQAVVEWCKPHMLQTPECEGLQRQRAGELEAAIEKYKAALTPAEEKRETEKVLILRSFLISACLEAAGTYQQQDKPDKASEFFETALKALQDLSKYVDEQQTSVYFKKYRSLEATLFGLVAMAQGDRGYYKEEIELFRREKDLSEEAGNRQLELLALMRLGKAYLHDHTRTQDALLAGQQALGIAKELGPKEEADVLSNLAFLSDIMGDVDNVWRYRFQALELIHQIGDLAQEASVLTEVGRLHQDASQYDKALNYYYQAFDKFQETKDQEGQGKVLALMAGVYLLIDDVQAAAQRYQGALEASKAAHDISDEIRVLANLLLVYARLGNREKLLEYARQYDEIAEGVFKQAVLAAQKGSLEQKSQAIENIAALAYFVQNSGGVIVWGNAPDQAISLLTAALQMYQFLPHTIELLKENIKCLHSLSLAYIRLGQYEEAMRALQQAEAINRPSNSLEAGTILATMGRVRENQGRLQEALALYMRAVENLENVGLLQRLEELKIPFREAAFQGYSHIVEILFKLHIQKPEQYSIEQAFLYHEKGKARTLLELLEEAKVRVREGIEPALVQEEEQITIRISRFHRVLSNPELSKDQEKQLVDNLEKQEQAWQALQVKMAVANPKYAELTSPQVAGIPQVQALLDKETILVEYALGGEKSFLWGITKDGMQAYELPAEEAITQLVKQYMSSGQPLEPYLNAHRSPLFPSETDKDEIKRHVELGKKLYNILLQPVASLLQGKNKIIVVPDGGLYYLPFETLIIDTDENNDAKSNEPPTFQSIPYLVKAYPVTYAPSASVLVTLEKNRDRRHQEKNSIQAPLLAFGDPVYEAIPVPQTVALNVRGAYEERSGGFQRLAYSAQEVKKIAEIYGIAPPSDALNLQEKATEKRLREIDLTPYRILHFATHAILSDEVKWITQPALVLSLTGTDDTYDGFLQMSEIFNLRLNADLVVLSACDTGRGKLYRGEGIVGLTRAFMYAGTPSVVASLWQVNDQSTSLFMEFFYRNLKAGRSKAEALREAKKQMLQTRARLAATGKEESLAAPYFWAPFILIGKGS